MLTRRDLLLSTLLISACATQSRALKEVLPPKIGDSWMLSATDPMPAEEAPAAARTLGVVSGIEARYQSGARVIKMRLLDMKAETNAFELVQKWRPQDGQAHYRGRYFFVAESASESAATLSAFLHEFRSAVPAE